MSISKKHFEKIAEAIREAKHDITRIEQSGRFTAANAAGVFARHLAGRLSLLSPTFDEKRFMREALRELEVTCDSCDGPMSAARIKSGMRLCGECDRASRRPINLGDGNAPDSK